MHMTPRVTRSMYIRNPATDMSVLEHSCDCSRDPKIITWPGGGKLRSVADIALVQNNTKQYKHLPARLPKRDSSLDNMKQAKTICGVISVILGPQLYSSVLL